MHSRSAGLRRRAAKPTGIETEFYEEPYQKAQAELEQYVAELDELEAA